MEVAGYRTCVDHSILLSRLAVFADGDVAVNNQLAGKSAGAQSHTDDNGMHKLRAAKRRYASRYKCLLPHLGIKTRLRNADIACVVMQDRGTVRLVVLARVCIRQCTIAARWDES